MDRHVPHPRQIVRASFAVVMTSAAFACVAATGASARPAVVGHLKMCAYFTVNDTAATGNVKVKAAGAAGRKGAFALKGSAANITTHFKVRPNGTAFTSFAVPGPGTERVVVTLGLQTRAMSLALPAGTNVKQTTGCTPR
jgi:hypothetical protein